MEEGPRKRTRRSAAARRAQRERATARVAQALLRGFAELRQHRGGRPSRLAAALAAALDDFPGTGASQETAYAEHVVNNWTWKDKQEEQATVQPNDVPEESRVDYVNDVTENCQVDLTIPGSMLTARREETSDVDVSSDGSSDDDAMLEVHSLGPRRVFALRGVERV